MKIILIFLNILFFTNKNNIDLEGDKRHAYHVSKTDMIYKAEEKSLQITMHIFIDDLEVALEKQGSSKLFVGTEKEKKETNGLIIKYLQNNFFIKLNNKPVVYNFIGKETTNDKQALWVYLEVQKIKDLKNIFVENKVLTEAFSDQKNIVQINMPSKKQGYFLLDRNKTSDTAQF